MEETILQHATSQRSPCYTAIRNNSLFLSELSFSCIPLTTFTPHFCLFCVPIIQWHTPKSLFTLYIRRNLLTCLKCKQSLSRLCALQSCIHISANYIHKIVRHTRIKQTELRKKNHLSVILTITLLHSATSKATIHQPWVVRLFGPIEQSGRGAVARHS